MQYLTQPRGPGKSWVFRMATPDALKGLANPKTGKPFGKEIKIGLATRHLPTARMRRDQLLGELRQLQATASGGKSFTLGDALDWRDDMLEARERDPTGREAEAMGMALTDLLILQEQRGARVQPLQRFARVALADGFPLSTARDQYVKERSPGNAFNFKPLKSSTVRELDIALGHLQSFLSASTAVEAMICPTNTSSHSAWAAKLCCLTPHAHDAAISQARSSCSLRGDVCIFLAPFQVSSPAVGRVTQKA